MGDGRTRKIYRSLAGALAMTLVIGTLGCGMPSENESSMEPEKSVATEVASTPEDSGESSSEVSQAVSESSSAEESSESASSDGGESTPAESTKTRKSVKDPGEPKEYVWDFDDLVNAQWKEQEKKEHPKGSTFVGNYSKAMEDYLNDIVENTNLDELSKDDGLYKALYVYHQLEDYKHRGKSTNASIKARLDRIDAVQSLEELYELYSDEEFSRYNRLISMNTFLTGSGTYVTFVEPATITYDDTAMSKVQSICMTNCLTQIGFDKKRAKEIVDGAMTVDKRVEEYCKLETYSEAYISKKTLERKEIPVPVVDILIKLDAIPTSGEYVGTEETYGLYRELYQPENLEALKDYMMVTALYRLGAWADPETVKSIVTVMWEDVAKDAYENQLKGLLLYCAADLLAAEYDRRFVSDKSIYAETEELLGEIKASMRESFDNIKWDFPYYGKEFVEKKLDYLKVYVGRNGDYNDLSDVELTEDPVDNVVALMVSQERFERKQLKKTLDDRTMTGMNMFETNAYYVPRLNSVMVNSAWLSMYSDLKEKELQGDGLQYEETLAWLGSLLAHEIGHAYSPDSGHFYNFRGINLGWMSDREAEQYDAYVDGIIQFFNEMEVEYGYKLDGELVSDETFADLMSIGCCLRMLGKRDDPDFDLFFRSYAMLNASNYSKSMMKEMVKDEHLPDKERTNCILAQFEEFYDTYDVDPESPYYVAPENRLKGFW